jgi:LytS/YehU family sensor histidine kinase
MYLDRLYTNAISQSTGKGSIDRESACREFAEPLRCITFTIEVPEDKRNLRIPVLSLLPLVENVTVHNIIDSEHRMDILIRLNERMELVVSNPIYPKLTLPDTNGTGLKNLENRFLLLMNKQIRVESDEDEFQVYLPLK